ncbi:MAG: MATE family efflux transporter [Clostridia bacterium]|nr:MATE family efflux transporter [Clostridia bacterium]
MLFSNRDLVKITLPLIFQQLLNVLVSTIDSLMVASVGEAAVSGIALIGSLDVVLVTFFSSLTAGGTVIISQLLGKKKHSSVSDATKQALYLSLAGALLITLLVQCFRYPLLNLLFGDAEADVMHHAHNYFFFISLSFPFLAIESACGAAFRAAGDSMTSLLSSIGINLMNIFGNYILIYVIPLEAAGAAISTLIARAIATVVMVIMLHSKKRSVYVEHLFHYRPDWRVIRSILRIGIPHGIENCMFQFGRLLTQSLISTLGTVAITANSVANTLAGYQYMPGTAIGNTSVIVIGRCVGAGEKKQAKRYSRILLLTSYACIWIVVLVTFFFAKPIIGAWQLSAETADLTRRLILYHSLWAAAVWPIGFVLPSMFRAASDVKFPMVVSVTCMWIFRIALSYVFVPAELNLFGLTLPGLGMGVMGVWVAMTVDWVVRISLYAYRYFSGKWLTVYDIKK